jgi:hypothetical protein
MATSVVARLDPASTSSAPTTARPIDNTLETVEYLLRITATLYDKYVQEGVPVWTALVRSQSTPRVRKVDA